MTKLQVLNFLSEQCLASDAVWQFENGRIGLRANTGESVQLTAMEVFQAVFGRTRNLRGYMVPEPAKSFEGLSFSRFPAEPCIRSFERSGSFHVEVGVSIDGQFVAVEDGVDQITVGRKWFPIQLDRIHSISEWMVAVGANESGLLTLGALIALRTRGDKPAKIIDEISTTSLTLAAALWATEKSIPGLDADLYDYQVAGVGFLKFVTEQDVGCVLADEMGLGKTLQIIALLLAESNAGRRQSLIIAPATLLENWRREFAKFAPSLTVLIHAGSDRPGIAAGLRGFDVTVVSYETAIRDEPLLSAVHWNVIALDEAQNIKNPEAQRTTVVKRLPRRVSIAVTGTPLENRVDDLWSIADFALPGLLGSFGDFRKTFSDDLSDACRLGSLVAPIVLRRRVHEVAKDLPEKIEIPQPLKSSRKFAEGYEELRLRTLADYESNGELVAMTRLRMYCAHPKLTGSLEDDLEYEMPKYQRLVEILDEVFSANQKALIFSTYTGMADLLTTDLPKRFQGGFFKSIDGRLDVPSRQVTVDAFFDHDSYGALILNPKAAGVGLNITAANHVIHYNPEWNPALTDQATARAYRRKQTRPVTVHHLYFVDTVEEVMIERASFKRQLAGEAVTGHVGEIDVGTMAAALKISPL